MYCYILYCRKELVLVVQYNKVLDPITHADVCAVEMRARLLHVWNSKLIYDNS